MSAPEPATLPKVGPGLYRLRGTEYHVRRHNDRCTRERSFGMSPVPVPSWWIEPEPPGFTNPDNGYPTLGEAARALANAVRS
jgi:hypothetical protein